MKVCAPVEKLWWPLLFKAKGSAPAEASKVAIIYLFGGIGTGVKLAPTYACIGREI